MHIEHVSPAALLGAENGELFLPRMFQGFPEMKEALISNKVQAAFIVAPMAIALAAQGVPIKVVYLGHRYGSSLVVRKNGPVRSASARVDASSERS